MKQPQDYIEELFTEKLPDGRTHIKYQGIANCTPKTVEKALTEYGEAVREEERNKCLFLAQDRSMSVSWILGGEDFVQLKDLKEALTPPTP